MDAAFYNQQLQYYDCVLVVHVPAWSRRLSLAIGIYCSCVTVAAIALLGITIWHSKRDGQKNLWIFRWVKDAGNSRAYLMPNLAMISLLTAFLGSMSVSVFYFAMSAPASRTKGVIVAFFGISGWIFPFLGVLHSAWSSILGLVLSSSIRTSSSLIPALSATLSNILLIGTTVVSTIFILTLGICMAVACRKSQTVILQMQADPTSSRIMNRVQHWTNFYNKTWLASFVIYIAVTLLFAVICVAAVITLRLNLGRRLKKLDRLHKELRSAKTPITPTGPSFGQSLPPPSSTALLPAEDEVEAHEQLDSLRQAYRNLLIIFGVLSLAGMPFIAVALIAINTLPPELSNTEGTRLTLYNLPAAGLVPLITLGLLPTLSRLLRFSWRFPFVGSLTSTVHNNKGGKSGTSKNAEGAVTPLQSWGHLPEDEVSPKSNNLHLKLDG